MVGGHPEREVSCVGEARPENDRMASPGHPRPARPAGVRAPCDTRTPAGALRLPNPADYYREQGSKLTGGGEWKSAICQFHDETRPDE